MNGQTYILDMKSIDKAFFGTAVLSNANFNVRPGELHALIGENGAGKSTLMKQIANRRSVEKRIRRLSGYYTKYSK